MVFIVTEPASSAFSMRATDCWATPSRLANCLAVIPSALRMARIHPFEGGLMVRRVVRRWREASSCSLMSFFLFMTVLLFNVFLYSLPCAILQHRYCIIVNSQQYIYCTWLHAAQHIYSMQMLGSTRAPACGRRRPRRRCYASFSSARRSRMGSAGVPPAVADVPVRHLPCALLPWLAETPTMTGETPVLPIQNRGHGQAGRSTSQPSSRSPSKRKRPVNFRPWSRSGIHTRSSAHMR